MSTRNRDTIHRAGRFTSVSIQTKHPGHRGSPWRSAGKVSVVSHPHLSITLKNLYARAYENGGDAAWVLVNVLKLLADKLPNNKLSIVCHSLGSRVVIRALALALKEERDEALH